MDYTNEQYSVLEQAEVGFIWEHMPPEKHTVMLYLESQRLIESRVDVLDGLYLLSEGGKRVLLARRQELALQKELAEKELKETADRAAQKSEEKAEKKKERIFQTFLVFLGYLLGLITPYIPAVILWILDFVARSIK